MAAEDGVAGDDCCGNDGDGDVNGGGSGGDNNGPPDPGEMELPDVRLRKEKPRRRGVDPTMDEEPPGDTTRTGADAATDACCWDAEYATATGTGDVDGSGTSADGALTCGVVLLLLLPPSLLLLLLSALPLPLLLPPPPLASKGVASGEYEDD